jgi:protease-4
MAQMLKQVREDEQIKAVVLRIDSPGGSAPASEAIRSEILRLKKTGKPVVVSMSSMAASGGYWMAAPADEIWAYPATITGSIGVYGVLADIEQGLEKLGVHTDGLGTTAVAGGVRADRQLPPELAKVMQLSIQHIYGRFLNIVSEGRNISEDKVARLAEGRVWTGLEAKKLGLVDHLGGFDEAIAAAAKRARLGEDYDRVWIRPPQNLKDIILSELFGNADTFLSGMIRNAGDQLLSLTGFSVTKLWMQNMAQLSQLMGLSARQPGIFTICNLWVE